MPLQFLLLVIVAAFAATMDSSLVHAAKLSSRYLKELDHVFDPAYSLQSRVQHSGAQEHFAVSGRLIASMKSLRKKGQAGEVSRRLLVNAKRQNSRLFMLTHAIPHHCIES